RAQILNVGCGPAWEMQEVIRNEFVCNHADFTLVDFDVETLQHAEGKLLEAKRQFGRTTGIHVHRTSVQKLLLSAQKSRSALPSQYDLICCGGLFDYLNDRTCRALTGVLWESLLPGGLLIVANMDNSRPFRNFSEYILDWHLIYRNSRDLLTFCTREIVEHSTTIPEATMANKFLNLRRPA